MISRSERAKEIVESLIFYCSADFSQVQFERQSTGSDRSNSFWGIMMKTYRRRKSLRGDLDKRKDFVLSMKIAFNLGEQAWITGKNGTKWSNSALKSHNLDQYRSSSLHSDDNHSDQYDDGSDEFARAQITDRKIESEPHRTRGEVGRFRENVFSHVTTVELSLFFVRFSCIGIS